MVPHSLHLFCALILVLSRSPAWASPFLKTSPCSSPATFAPKEHSPIADLHRLMVLAEPDFIDADHDGVPEKAQHPTIPNARPGFPNVSQLPLMILAGMFGVLLGDSIVFSIGRRGIDSRQLRRTPPPQSPPLQAPRKS